MNIKHFAITILMMLFLSINGFSQSQHGLSFKYLYPDFLSPMQNKFINLDQENIGGVEVGYYYDLNESIRLGVPFRMGKVNYPQSTTDASQIDNQLFWSLDAHLIFKFNNGKILKKGAKVAPYLVTGMGFEYLTNEQDKAKATFPIGAGLNIALSKNVSLQLQSEYRFSEYNHYHHSIGIVANFGKKTKETIVVNTKPPKLENPKSTGLKTKDTDKDGVRDVEDECPEIAGSKDNFGCPVVEEADEKVLVKATQKIRFATASSIINKNSYTELDEVAKMLNEQPHYNLRIEGHADKRGSKTYNHDLAQRRAKACLEYLAKKGVDRSRMSFSSYGETHPAEVGQSSKALAENRRVEFSIYFK